MSDIDQEALLDELEKENKILEQELELIMNKNNPEISAQQGYSQRDRKITDDEEMFSYSQSGRAHYRGGIYDQEYGQDSAAKEEPYRQNGMKLINSLFEKEKHRLRSPIPSGREQQQQQQSAQSAGFSPISSLKNTSTLEGKFAQFDSCEDIGESGIKSGQENEQIKKQTNIQKNEKISSLEMRLSGTQKAVKELEKQLRQKDIMLKETNLELAKKTKELERSQQASASLQPGMQASQKSLALQGSISEYLKRERVLEKKLRESEGVISDLKKSNQRYLEVNQSLVQRVRELEKNNSESLKQGNDESENTLLRLKNEELLKTINENRDQYDYLQIQYSTLKQLAMEHLQHSNQLHTAYSNLDELINN